jgi:hypothetical protein
MKREQGKREGGREKSAEKPDEFTRGLEYVRDLLKSVVPATVSVGELRQARATTGALIEMREVELRQPEGVEEIEQYVYEMAARAVELMKRAGMQESHEVSFNSLSEIASFLNPARPAQVGATA